MVSNVNKMETYQSQEFESTPPKVLDGIVEKPKANPAEIPAMMDLKGQWWTSYMGDGLKVTPLNGDVLRGLEKQIEAELEAKKLASVKDTIAHGGHSQSPDSLSQLPIVNDIKTPGYTEFISLMFHSISNGVVGKTSEVFLMPKSTENFFKYRRQADVKGQQLNTSPTLDDEANEPTLYCFLVGFGKGQEIHNILQSNGHTLTSLNSGQGFQAEIGRVRMVFIYPDKDKKYFNPEEDKKEKEDNKKEGGTITNINNKSEKQKVDKESPGGKKDTSEFAAAA